MPDIALTQADAEAAVDLSLTDDDVTTDAGLRTAVLLSLFTDRRANDDDPLPDESGDRRGWWADELAELEGDRMGSRLWLLERAKRGPGLGARAEQLAREALQWLLEDRVAQAVAVTATEAPEALYLALAITRPTGDTVTYRFQHVWEGEASNAL